ncbi:MAG: hypothetical protein ACK55X_15840 [Synechococcaceae cyanobacterium]
MSTHGPGDPREGAVLVTVVYGMLQLLRIECPLLGAANTRSAREV